MNFAPDQSPLPSTGREGDPAADTQNPPPALPISTKLTDLTADAVAALPDERLELIAETIIHLEIKLARSPQGLDGRLILYRQVWAGLETRRPDLLIKIKAKARRKRDAEGWPHPTPKAAPSSPPKPPANDNKTTADTPHRKPPDPDTYGLRADAMTDADFDALPDSELQYLTALAKHVLLPSATTAADLADIYDRYRILFCAIDRRWPNMFRQLADQAKAIRAGAGQDGVAAP